MGDRLIGVFAPIFSHLLCRIYLGGWSDTPPITYEHGGVVINAAITIDGKKPIGARARRIPEYRLVLNLQTASDVIGQVCEYVFV